MVKFTIITVCYNAKGNLKKTVESVLGQKYSNIEYLIIDGGSKDGCINEVRQYIEHDVRVKLISEQDYGIYNAMNKGITLAQGDYINFMNAGDTFFDCDVLTNVSNIIEKQKPDILYGKANVIEKGRKSGTIIGRDNLDLKGFVRIIGGEWAYHQAVFSKASNLRQYYFNEKYKIAADYDWFVRNIKDRTRIQFCELIICNYIRDGFSCQRKNRIVLRKEQNEIIKRHFKIFYLIRIYLLLIHR